MSSMESLDKLQAELSGNVYADAFHTLYKLSQDVSVEHSELMAQAIKRVHKEKVEPLEVENAKLRELVKDMWPHVRHRSRMCVKCDLPCDTSDECLLYEPMRQRMRELGLVVE